MKKHKWTAKEISAKYHELDGLRWILNRTETGPYAREYNDLIPTVMNQAGASWLSSDAKVKINETIVNSLSSIVNQLIEETEAEFQEQHIVIELEPKVKK